MSSLADILRNYDIDEEKVASILTDYANSLTISLKKTKTEKTKSLAPSKKVKSYPNSSTPSKKVKSHSKSRAYLVTSLSPKIIKKEIPDIRRGDVVYDDKDLNRNIGKYMWDGESIIELNYEHWDYGTLPSEFTLNEFPDPRYFDDSVESTAVRWIRFDVDDIVKIVPGKYFIVTIVAENGKEYSYKILYEDKKKTKKGIYNSLNFENGVLAIEDESHGDFNPAERKKMDINVFVFELLD